MKFLCLGYYDEKKFETLPKAELDAIVRRTSLESPRVGKARRPLKGEVSVTGGPFTATKEQVGAFFIIEAGNLDESVRGASNHPAAHLGESVGWGAEVRAIDMFEQL